MPRLARVVVPGLPHHITQRGNRRQQTGVREAGQVRYWQYGQAEKSPDLAISDLSRFLVPIISFGTRLATTEMTPSAPIASMGSVRVSLPERTVSSVRQRISLAWSTDPLASLMATMFSTWASRSTVWGSR